MQQIATVPAQAQFSRVENGEDKPTFRISKPERAASPSEVELMTARHGFRFVTAEEASSRSAELDVIPGTTGKWCYLASDEPLKYTKYYFGVGVKREDVLYHLSPEAAPLVLAIDPNEVIRIPRQMIRNAEKALYQLEEMDRIGRTPLLGGLGLSPLRTLVEEAKRQV